MRDLPPAITLFTWLNPLSYGVDLLRGTRSVGFHFGAAHDAIILASVTTFLVAIGSRLFSTMEA